MESQNPEEEKKDFYCGHVGWLEYRNCTRQCFRCAGEVKNRQEETRWLLKNKD